MNLTKLKIISISLIIIGIILWNFWYYLRPSSWDSSIKPINQQASSPNSPKKSIPTNMVTSEDTIPLKNQITSPEVPDNQTINPVSEAPLPPKKQNIPKTSNTVNNMTSSNNDSEEPKSGNIANYATLEKILVDTSWSGSSNNYTNYWGNENISFLGDSLKVFYPKGSNAPSNTPRGWAGFVYNFPKTYNHLSLSYTIRFEDGFDFVKWGKLPGLCWGNCSRWESMSTASGFSLRFVWKKDGYLDIMSFLPNTVKSGNYSGEKMFKFVPWKEYLLTQQITLNDIGKENGIITILVDSKPVYTKNDVTFRVSEDVSITSFLFSTFFGGKDDTYSSSKDTSIYFWKFKISDTF